MRLVVRHLREVAMPCDQFAPVCVACALCCLCTLQRLANFDVATYVKLRARSQLSAVSSGPAPHMLVRSQPVRAIARPGPSLAPPGALTWAGRATSVRSEATIDDCIVSVRLPSERTKPR